MASGLFVYHVAKSMGFNPKITHAGKVDRKENFLMTKTFDIPLVRYDKNEDNIDPESFDSFLYVDHSGSHSKWHQEEKIPEEKLAGIIDHHEIDLVHPDKLFVDKRRVGSVSSIMAEYLQEGAAEEFFSEDEDLFKKICGALLLGIRTDTAGLTREVQELDNQMHYYLQTHADMELVKGVENIKVPIEWKPYKDYASSSSVMKNNVMFASVGFISEKDKGAISWVSDDLIQYDIKTVYVLGIQAETIEALRYNDGSICPLSNASRWKIPQ